MIGTQLLDDALVALGFLIGLTIILSASFVVIAALWQRHERQTGISAIERHLAAIAARQSPDGGEPTTPPRGSADSPAGGATH
jgi:hypothetical protein